MLLLPGDDSYHVEDVRMSTSAEFQPAAEPVREPAPELTVRVTPNLDEAPTTVSQPQATVVDDRYFAIMIACCSLFAAAFALYVLYPAISTLFGT